MLIFAFSLSRLSQRAVIYTLFVCDAGLMAKMVTLSLIG
jgi:hypothetical protein